MTSRQVLFKKIARTILGPRYSLTITTIGPAEIKKLNLIYRNKNSATDILSFPLSKTEGEIYLCLSEARREAKKFGRTYENFLAFLLIHGCVHLKGYDHSATMERIERKWRAQLLRE